MAHKTVNVTISLLDHYAGKPPEYNYDNDSGFDLYASEKFTLPPGNRKLIPTGIRVAIPDNYELQVRSRSGKTLKEGLIVLNNPGTVDAGYRGEVAVIAYNAAGQTVTIEKGDKIAQAVICPVVQANFVPVDNLEDTARGDKGYGSTDAKKGK